MNNLQVLNFVSLIILILEFQIFRWYLRKIDILSDELDVAANDYTFIVKNIPLEFQAKNNDYDDDLKQFLEENALDVPLNIVHVNLAYKLEDLEKL